MSRAARQASTSGHSVKSGHSAKSALLVTHNYPPESNAAAKRARAIATFLVKQGWRVSVITLLPHHPQNKLFDGFDVATPLHTLEDGVEITRLRPWIVPKQSLALRLLSESLFALQAFWRVFQSDGQLLFTSIPYMFLAPLGLLAARLTKRPYLLDVRDLTWLYPAAAGKNTFGLERALAWLMRRSAARSDTLTTATEGLLHYFQARPKSSAVIPNGVAQNLLDDYAEIAATSPLQDRPVVVLYAGLLGFPQRLSTLIEVAKRLPDIKFRLAGDGPEKDKLLAAAAGLSNVTFLGYLSPAALREAYREADILVAQLARNPVFAWAQPSKLWEYMATGRPVVYGGEGEVVQLIEAHGVAKSVPPEDPEAMTTAIRSLVAAPDAARRLGAKGRAFVNEQRCRETILTELEQLFTELLVKA